MDPAQTRLIASVPLNQQVARAALAGALGAAGVVALSAAALALFFGLVPAKPFAVIIQPAKEPGIIGGSPALPDSNLAMFSQLYRDKKPFVAEQTSEVAAPDQETTAMQALPPEAPARVVSLMTTLLSPTPFGPQPVSVVPATFMQTRSTSAEPMQTETALARAVVTQPRPILADKKVTNPVSERGSAVARIKKARVIAPVRSTVVNQLHGTEVIHAQSGVNGPVSSSHEHQRYRVTGKPATATAATPVTVLEAIASPSQAAQSPAETEPLEETEVLGLKVPSLSQIARKFRNRSAGTTPGLSATC